MVIRIIDTNLINYYNNLIVLTQMLLHCIVVRGPVGGGGVGKSHTMLCMMCGKAPHCELVCVFFTCCD